jgi:hypothetical protein
MTMRSVLLVLTLASASMSHAQPRPVFQQAPTPSQPATPVNKARTLLAKKGVVVVREFSAPITLDTKNSTSVDVAAYTLQVEGDAASKLKGLRIKIKYDNKGFVERLAYLDLDEAEAFSSALAQLSTISMRWLEAKRKGNSETEFSSQDGFAIGFTVDTNGEHQGYFSIENQKVYFPMSPTLITAVKGHIDKLLADLKRV